MRKLTTLFLLALLPMMASAQSNVDGIYYYLNPETRLAEVTNWFNGGDYEGIEHVTIPATFTHDGTKFTVRWIGSTHGAFNGCSTLKSVTLPNTIISIDNGAFMDCPNLTSITIPSSVTSIGNGAFSASGLKSITIPSSVKTINLRAFRNCTELASITFGSGVTSIGEAAFANCTSLTSVTIPRKVESIDFDAFYGCESLKSFTIGSGVKSIGSGVVSNCPSLLDIFCEAVEVPEANNAFEEWKLRSAILYVPEESIEAYSTTAPWSSFRKIVPLGTEPPADAVAINETNFPDANFRNFLLSQDYGADGILTRIEASNIPWLEIDNKGIQNLKGIEYFFALEYLYIYQNCIKGEAMDALIEALPIDKEGDAWFPVMYNSGEQNEMTSAQVAAAKAKGWIPKEYNGSYWSDYDPSTNVVINETNFPDENFRNWVLSQTYGADGVLTANEVSMINTIEVTNKSIKRLKGIESFTAMRYFYCSRNQIKGTAMDELIECLPSSSNSYIMYVFDNQYVDEKNMMTTTQVAASKAKGWIPYYNAGREGWKEYAGSEPEPEPEPGPDPEPSGDGVAINETNFPDANFRKWLLAQDYGQDVILTEEEIAGVTSIDVWSKQIEDLQGIGFFTALTYLDCSSNNLTSLDVSGCTALTYLNCSSDQLTSLDVSKNTALTELNCSWNKITSIDISKNTALTSLDCSSNKITSIDVANNKTLETLICGGGNLASLNVSGCTALKWLVCNYNYWQLSSLDVSGCTALTHLDCSTNRLTSLDVSKNTALTELNCSDNVQLTSLNVSGCTALTKLECSDNQLTSLDVSGCTALTTLDCSNNQITSLNASGCTNLTTVDCYQNQINEKAMNAVVKNLPTVSGGTLHIISERNEQNVMSTTQVAAAKAKGWTPYEQRDRWWFEYAGSEPGPDSDPIPSGDGVAINEANFPDANFRNYLLEQSYGSDGVLTETEIKETTLLFVEGKDIESLEGIEYFKNLQYLYCDNNKLISLDVSKNLVLQGLICNNNKLTSLNVSENSELYWLYIYQNQIKGAAMDSLVKHLPIVRNGQMQVIYNENEGNVMTTAQVSAAKAKGWLPAYCTGQAYNEQWDEYYDVWKVIPDVLRGDVNGDGKVDMDDATFVTNIILGIEDSTEAADVNNDGVVSMPDAMFIVNYIKNGKFPDE